MSDPIHVFWTQRQDIGPSARSKLAMAYDLKRKRTVLFGGTVSLFNTANNLADTWEWDGDFWVQVAQFGPPPMAAHAMAYDAKRGRVVLFGGRSATWEWDGLNWTQVADTGPVGASNSAMVYDPNRECIVLFGGYGGGEQGSTWQWDSVEWTQVSEVGPAARQSHAMAYDTTRRRVVLFGGWSSGILLGDTWEWDGTTWEQTAAFGPSARVGHAMAFDAERACVVLYGGTDTQSTQGIAISARQDTWDWDGQHWLQRQDMGPAPRVFPALAFDNNRKRIVLFGGNTNDAPTGMELGDTWELSELRLLTKEKE